MNVNVRTDTSAAPTSDTRRKKIVFAALGALVVAGAAVALFLPDQKPALSIPDRVCAEAVPSTHVKALLPEKGEAFEEERAYNFFTGATPKGLGKCELSGGGRTLGISYSRIQEREYDREWVRGLASKPGHHPITWGAAGGFVTRNNAALFVDCPNPKRMNLMEVSVGIGGGPETEDPAIMAELSALAADIARAVTRDIELCKGAEDLPENDPTLD
ncbi:MULTISPECIES: hypothetical protein [unclassified Streptomyces]|uniref:hypothetical protein n=1 Tax=unclassified Streptomyces TaxID=2593676 RepID=UPI000CD56B4C|nr:MULTISPECIES: hypothetical protein [unclassified Streptomyces]AWL38300.1 hypothetical protein B9S64_09360 [Streptomyces sp. SM18]